MSNTVVTRLEVDASQAVAGLNAYEKAVDKAATAEERMAAADAKVQAAMNRSTALHEKAQAAMRGSVAGLNVYEQSMQKLARAADQRAANDARVQAAMQGSALGAVAVSRMIDDANSRAAKSWSRLQASIDPVYAANKRMERAAVQGAAAIRGGVASYDEVAGALDTLRIKQELAAQSWSKTGKVANDNIGLAAHQMGNLRSQAIDAGTMLASGSSPLQILATQSGQVYEALAGHEKGVTGALKALGASAVAAAASIGPIGWAIAGVTAAVGALAYAYRSTIPDMDETLEKHGSLIDRVAEKYEDLQGRIDAVGRAASSGLNVEAGAIGRDLAKIAEEQTKALQEAFVGVESWWQKGSIQGANPLGIAVTPDLAPISKQLDGYRAALAEGRDVTIEFRQELADLYQTAGAKGDVETQKAIERAFELTNALAGVTKGIRENRAAIDEMGKPRSADEQLKIDDPAEWKRQNDLLKEQEKAIEAGRRKMDDYRKSVADMSLGLADSVSGLQVQIDAFGLTEGAAAALRFETDALAQAKRAAAEAGQIVTPDQIAEIKNAAGEIGTMTDRLAELNAEQARNKRIADFEKKLDFDISIAGLPEAEREVRRTLDGLGIAFESEQGQRIAGNMRFLDSLDKTKTALRETGDIGRDAFEGIFGALAKGGDVLDAVTGELAACGGPIGTLNTLFEGEAE